jgi:hypothetical protein
MSNSRALLSLLFAVSVSAAPAKLDPAKLREAVAHPDVMAAVKTQNSEALGMPTVRVIERRWTLGKERALVRHTTTGKCAAQLRAFVAANPLYAEVFVLDNQGVVVCASERTASFFYGEEPFWQQAAKDETFRDATRIAIPVREEERTIGAITARVALK